MTPRPSSPSFDSPSEHVRKRVCKACDRCRMKKSKCDGANPCGRCRADNAICVFGERKKTPDKIYPKGYVEMLEQQQIWLISGLQELYRRVHKGEGWPGDPLKPEPNGQPLTHDLLTRLGALNLSKGERFEENIETLQQDLWNRDKDLMRRQESSDGSSESSQSPLGARGEVANNHPSPLTSSTCSPIMPMSGLIGKSELHFSLPDMSFADVSMSGVVDPIALQIPPDRQWPTRTGLGFFDNIEFMDADDSSSFMAGEECVLSGSFYSNQLAMNCMPGL